MQGILLQEIEILVVKNAHSFLMSFTITAIHPVVVGAEILIWPGNHRFHLDSISHA